MHGATSHEPSLETLIAIAASETLPPPPEPPQDAFAEREWAVAEAEAIQAGILAPGMSYEALREVHRSIARRLRALRDAPKLAFLRAFKAWIDDAPLGEASFSGNTPSVTSSDAYRLFCRFAENQGYWLPSEMSLKRWGSALRKVGVRSGKVWIPTRGGSNRVLLVSKNLAVTWKQWLADNPPPPTGCAPLRVKPRKTSSPPAHGPDSEVSTGRHAHLRIPENQNGKIKNGQTPNIFGEP